MRYQHVELVPDIYTGPFPNVMHISVSLLEPKRHEFSSLSTNQYLKLLDKSRCPGNIASAYIVVLPNWYTYIFVQKRHLLIELLPKSLPEARKQVISQYCFCSGPFRGKSNKNGGSFLLVVPVFHRWKW